MFFIGLLLIGLGGTAACEQRAEVRSDRDYRIAVVAGDADPGRFEAIVAGARLAADRFPFLRVTAVRAEAGESRADALRRAGTSADFVAFYARDADVRQLPINELQRNGVGVIALGGQVTHEPRVHRVIVEWPALAEAVSRALPRLAADRASFVLLHRRSSGVDAEDVYRRFAAPMAQRRDPVLLGEADLVSVGGVAAGLAELLGEYPRSRLVVSLDATPWLGQSPPVLPESADLLLFDAQPALWPLLRSGAAVALAGPLDGQIGAECVALVAELVNTTRRPIPDRRVACEIVTPAEFPDFARRYADAVGVPVSDLLP